VLTANRCVFEVVLYFCTTVRLDLNNTGRESVNWIDLAQNKKKYDCKIFGVENEFLTDEKRRQIFNIGNNFNKIDSVRIT
jgi:hypothetical protein